MQETRTLDLDWKFVSDTVMGGVSQGTISHTHIGGRKAAQLTGDVSLENNGGFLQIAADLAPTGSLDASDWQGFVLDVLGNDETYEIRLKTEQLTQVWQSFRAPFVASHMWTTLTLPFSAFKPYRTEVDFDPSVLRRIGILAVGRAFSADVAISNLRLYR
jgi:hypothetical protein